MCDVAGLFQNFSKTIQEELLHYAMILQVGDIKIKWPVFAHKIPCLHYFHRISSWLSYLCNTSDWFEMNFVKFFKT